MANGLADSIEAATIDFGTNTTINTGVNDDITITHDLGTADINVQITIVGTTPYHYTVHSKTSTTFTVRFYDPDGTSLAGITDIDFDWIARKQ